MYPFVSPCGLSFHHPSVQLPLTLTETVQARSKVSSSSLPPDNSISPYSQKPFCFLSACRSYLPVSKGFKGEVDILEVEVVQIDRLISTGCSLANPSPAQGEAANLAHNHSPRPTPSHNERAGESDPRVAPARAKGVRESNRLKAHSWLLALVRFP